MRFLLDTNALSDLGKVPSRVQARIDSLPPGDEVITSVAVHGEVLYGLERMPAGRRRDELAVTLQRVLPTVYCVSLTPAIATRFAKIRVLQQRRGLSLEECDLWIAATALEFGAVLVTHDSDFRRIPGLLVEDWTP